MRGSILRVVSAVLFASFAAGLAVWCGTYVSAQPGKAVQPAGANKDKGKEKEEDKGLRPASDAELLFAPPYERDAKKQIEAARDYLALKDRPWNTVCSLLQNILDSKSDSFFNVEQKATAGRRILRISVKTEANRIISAFPKEGLEFYQQAYGPAATAMLKEAVDKNYDMTTLAELSQRYFHTKAGGEGTVLLGTIYLERGNYLEAAYAFERLLGRPNSDELFTPRTLFKAAIAFKRSGDPRHRELYQSVADRLQKATARGGLTIGRKTFTSEQILAELDRPVEAPLLAATVGEWSTRYGNSQRNGTVEGGPPFLVPTFEPVPMLFTGNNAGNNWIEQQLSKLFDRDDKNNLKSLPLPGFFPVTTPDMVIFRSYDAIYAVATRDHSVNGEIVPAGKLLWYQKAMYGIHRLMTPGEFSDGSITNDVQGWWNAYLANASATKSLLYENPLIGALAHDGQYVYFIDDIALPPPPVMNNVNFGGMPGGIQQLRQSGELADAVRAGELNAVDMKTGLRVWTLGRVGAADLHYPDSVLPPRLTEEEADKTHNAFQLCLDAVFLGPPLSLNGRLYVLIEQAGVVRLLCLDPKNLVPVNGWHQKVPALIWSQKLGRPVNATNSSIIDPVRRVQGAFLAAGEGIVVCPTNSGMVIGVDVMSRSLLWAHAYRRQDANSVPKPAFDPMTGQPVMPSLLANSRWRAAAPIVSRGRVIIAAYDSDKLECLDVRSGKLLWSVPRRDDDLYVGGVVNDKVIVVGRSEVRAYNLYGENEETWTPVEAWKEPTKLTGVMPTGHGVVGKSAFYVPVRQDQAGVGNIPAGEIWAINTETGGILSKTAARKRNDPTGSELSRYGIGNLVFQDGLVIAQSPWEVAVYPQLEQKKAEMDRKLKANPKDPGGLTDRGELLLDDGKLKAAIADFKEAEKNNPTEVLRRRIREKLYIAYTEILREDFAAAEPYLKEYESLCEVPLDTDEPFEKTRRIDESLRRKRLYLYLLAKGREGQGRLGEAFDHYLSLASLGEGKTLEEMPDEPNVRMRPDVWARGRIEGMIRNAPNEAARKSLEDRVNTEWAAVREANDLDRLREFVSIFGSYFPAGSEAQLLLAERLIKTNNDNDVRDAQIYLAQLRATAEDRVVRARATETLARLMIKHEMLEDAVGLYLQLGNEFPDVQIREGKTGADFLTDLLTDRRLLPYLEPSRYPLPSRVQAKQMPPTGDANRGAAFEVEPEGELFPMFRRLRFVIDMTSSGNGSWMLRAYDRSTGSLRATFRDIAQPQPYNPAMFQNARFLQASGHLLVAHLGQWIYCFDLAEKKEQWRWNLLENSVGNVNARQIQDHGDDGVVITYMDGSTITIGKSVVLQPNYVALLTRDGLEVIEPTTKRQLWTRRNVSSKTHLYGDGRYLLLVETGADRRPSSTRLLRAVDGLVVEGVADAGPMLAAAKSYRLDGRNALLIEEAGGKMSVRLHDLSAGKDLWKREYDGKSIPIEAIDPEWTGFVKPTGEVEVLSVRTGQVAGKFAIDKDRVEDHLKGATEAQLFADLERFYVVLDRDAAAGGGGARMARRVPVYNNALRTHRVNGPMYCFDRGSGRRLWYVEGVLENQGIVLERFADLPVIIAAAPIMEKNMSVYKIVVIEKERGIQRFVKSIPNNGNFFQNLTIDLKNGTVDLHRYDMRIHISAEDDSQAQK